MSSIWKGQQELFGTTSCKRKFVIEVTNASGGPANRYGMSIGTGRPWIRFLEDAEDQWYRLDARDMRNVDLNLMTKWQLIFDKGNCYQWYNLHRMLFRLGMVTAVTPYM